MHIFAHLHSLLFYIFLLGPLWVPDDYKIYLYWYWIINLLIWLLLDRCPLFYLKSTPTPTPTESNDDNNNDNNNNKNDDNDQFYKDKDDYLIHLHELGWLNREDKQLKYQESIIRFVSGISPLIVILALGNYPIPTYIFAFIILLSFYKRCHKAIIACDQEATKDTNIPDNNESELSDYSISSNV
jgi:hypothetical protein